LEDRNIEFLGRIDHQVKIRGFRIELGEIESQLLTHEEIREAVVMAKADKRGNKCLCAYIVPDTAHELDISKLRNRLSANFPDYMIPRYFVPMEKIPLTPNGKVDRKVLPEPDIISGKDYTAPGNRSEQVLVGIWAETLGIEEGKIGIDTNFFQVGGHSLKAILLISRIHREFNTKIPLVEIFKRPDIRGLAEFIGSKAKERYVSIEAVESKEFYPLSSAQKRLYFLHQFEPGSTVYNLPVVMELRGPVDISRFENTFRKLIRRHESLRTSFEMVGEKPVQRIHEHVEFEIEYFAADERSPGQTRTFLATGFKDHHSSLIIHHFIRAFHLSNAPLLRVGLAKLEEKKYILLADMHHIISDGMSSQVLVQDFSAFYAAKRLPEIKLQYREYVEWQNLEKLNKEIQKQGEYWRNEFEGEIPVLELPTDYARPPVQVFEGNGINFEINKETSDALKALALDTGTTLYIVLLAIYTILLAKLTGREDIVIGTPVAGRWHASLEKIIGMFVNTLALRNYPSGEKRFLDFLGEVKDIALKGFENQEYQYEDLVEDVVATRDVSRNPLFDTMLVLQNFQLKKIEIPGLKLIPYEYENKTSKFDLSLTAVEIEEKLLFIFEYCTKLFKRETIERFIVYFKNIVISIVENKNRGISGLEILAEEEKRRILFDFNDTEAGYPKNKTISRLFAEQAERTPDNIALHGCMIAWMHGEVGAITYKELNEQSNRVARFLIEKGVLADSIVGIMMERSVEMIIGIFGILKSGGAYLPIDPAYPQERIDYMLKDSGAKILLSELSEVSKVSEGTEIVKPGELIEEYPAHLCYIIYTSGSTGKPKGVLIEHHSVINRLNWMQRFYPLEKDDVIMQKTPFIFDVSVWELSWWVLTGSSVFLLEPGAEKEPEKLVEAIEKHKITVMHFVPSMLNAFLEYIEGAGDLKKLAGLRRVFASGEALGVRQVETFNRLINRVNAAQLVNLYGPTEATVDVSYFNTSVGRDYDAIPIGKPIDNIQLYILDKGGCLQPPGIAGELCITGVGLARGYLNRCELTAGKFININHHSSFIVHHSILYRTGDLARRLPDGNIEFLGRLDNQVKIRGFRIELSELENILVKHGDIKEAVVLVNESSGGSKHLCAYFVPANPLTADNIREYLKAYLPSYMIPSYFIRVDRMPLLPNGKIDRLGFPKSGLAAEEDTFSPPTSSEEKILAETWAEVLEVDRVGIHENFFALGGDSIRSIVVVSRARARGLNFTTKQLFQYPTIKGLLKNINPLGSLNHLPTPKTILQPFSLISSGDRLKIPADVEDAYPLTMLQAGLIFQSELTHHTSMYHDVLTHKINGRFHRQLFQETVERMVKRHPIFRTTYDLKNYSRYLQLVHKEVPLPLQVEDLTGFPNEAREKIINTSLENERTRRIDWGRPGLIRFIIHILDQDTYQYSFSYHDSALDGWSVGSLNTELYLTYHSLLGEIEYTEKPRLDISFRDFVALEHQAMASEEVKNYWRKLLTGSTFTEIPRWPLEPAINGTERVIFKYLPISLFLSRQLKELAKTLGVPIKSVLMAAHCRVLGVLSGNSDILTGYEHSGRPEENDGEKILGLFLNTLPFRLKMPGGKWADIIRAAYNAEIELLPYRRYPMALMKQERKGEPLFEAVFNYTHFHVLKKLQQLPNIDLLEMGAMAETEFVFRAEFSQGVFTDNVQLSLHYHSNTFGPGQIEAIGRYYTRALELMCENTHEPYELQSLLPLEEQKKLLEEFNNTTAGYPLEQCFDKLFQANVQQAPGAAAVCFEEKCLTYKELDRRANRLARVLIERGIVDEAVVPVIMGRGIPLLTSILAIFKAGGAYLPIDTQYPAERIEGILNRSGCRLVLTENEFMPALSEITNKPSPNNNYDLFPIESILHSNGPGNNLPQRCAPRNLAYVIYTSGSTGVPKGVMIEHRGMLNHLHVKKTDLNVTSADIIAQDASQCFDISIWQFLLALMVGGKTVIYPDDLIMAPTGFISKIVKDQVTILEVVPSYLSIMQTSLDITFRKYAALKFLLVTGETLKPGLVEQWFEKCPHIPMVNAYGPTEASDDITHFIMHKAPVNGQIPIGKPVQNMRIYITDKQMQLCPIGVNGEICVSGVGVGRGYLHDEQRTKEVFIEDPFAGEKGMRLYKTGDLGRWLPDGNIDFIGRKDTQVKIRGFRIELGEIENRLLKHKEIKEAVVIVGDGEEKNEDKYLCAYIVAGREIETSGLKDYLSGALPGYMIPQNFVRLEKIPLTANGKIDKARLPVPTGTAGIRPVYAAPGNSMERKIVKIWSEVLKIDERKISIHDDFFALGGHSLKALEIMVKFGGEFSITKIFQYPTPRQLAENIINSKEPGDDRLLHRFDKAHENEEENVEVSIICFPYAGGSAVIYKTLADALTQLSNKTRAALYAVEMPGHNFTRRQIELESIHEIAHCCALEIKAKIKTPVILWGHCSGTAVTLETAKLLEEEGIDLRIVCLGGRLIDTPFQARIKSIKSSLSSYFGFKTDWTGAEIRDWLINTTGFTEFEGIGESESAFIIRNFRHDARLANEYFQNSLKSKSPWKLSAAIYNFTAKDDPLTKNYEKRYKNWSTYSDTVELITLEGGGHYFVKTRALETARIILDLWKKQSMGS
jgi:amino acid adenylation domain-containing protein